MSNTLSFAEHRRRQQAVDFAFAPVGLEGFKPSKEQEQLARRFANGEIELAELVRGPVPSCDGMPCVTQP